MLQNESDKTGEALPGQEDIVSSSRATMIMKNCNVKDLMREVTIHDNDRISTTAQIDKESNVMDTRDKTIMRVTGEENNNNRVGGVTKVLYDHVQEYAVEVDGAVKKIKSSRVTSESPLEPHDTVNISVDDSELTSTVNGDSSDSGSGHCSLGDDRFGVINTRVQNGNRLVATSVPAYGMHINDRLDGLLIQFNNFVMDYLAVFLPMYAKRMLNISTIVHDVSKLSPYEIRRGFDHMTRALLTRLQLGIYCIENRLRSEHKKQLENRRLNEIVGDKSSKRTWKRTATKETKRTGLPRGNRYKSIESNALFGLDNNNTAFIYDRLATCLMGLDGIVMCILLMNNSNDLVRSYMEHMSSRGAPYEQYAEHHLDNYKPLNDEGINSDNEGYVDGDTLKYTSLSTLANLEKTMAHMSQVIGPTSKEKVDTSSKV